MAFPADLLTAPRAALAALLLLPALITSGSAAPTHDRLPTIEQRDEAAVLLREEFADAPDGVDPMVTGPVTAAFRDRQRQAGCDTAEWPNIPHVCYPD
ncbi:MAG: hypothetical protein KF914_07705 [Rhizobiaceae bacterium]|nr:hypothetical protein [Rhizobiaceae bacterium]